jgi:hypothetical protein
MMKESDAMTYVKIGNTIVPAEINGIERDRGWDYRHTKSVSCSLSYAEAKSLFVDGVEWSQIYQEPEYIDEQGNAVTPDPIVMDNSQFDQVLTITENRDGTVTVKLGVTTAEEALEILMGG